MRCRADDSGVGEEWVLEYLPLCFRTVLNLLSYLEQGIQRIMCKQQYDMNYCADRERIAPALTVQCHEWLQCSQAQTIALNQLALYATYVADAFEAAVQHLSFQSKVRE